MGPNENGASPCQCFCDQQEEARGLTAMPQQYVPAPVMLVHQHAGQDSHV